jgi:signal transduction histidine kinase
LLLACQATNTEKFYISKDNRKIPMLFSGAALYDDKGEVIGVICIAQDLTERQKNESERTRLQEQIQRGQKMEAIGNLAGGVAHDLNNILSGIVSYPELILLDLPQDSPLRDPILTIKHSGDKASAIVQDLLTLARRGVSAMEVLKLNDIVTEYVESPELKKLKADEPDNLLEIRPAPRLLNMVGSRIHLMKTLMNLVTNAYEATVNSGTISIATMNRYIDRPMGGYEEIKEGEYVILKISDNGIGIPEQHISRIFEPFYSKKKMGRSGTGLGMAVVWGTVKDLHGYIDVESEVGKGTTFSLYFPASRKQLPGARTALAIEDYMGNGESILVVDDVAEQRKIAGSILKKLNYSVDSVASGEEAVEYMRHRSPALIVMDMIMGPGIDGCEAYKRIIAINPNQKAIIASGFSQSERVNEAQRLGASQYVRKPYTIEKIGMAIKKALE